MGGSEITKVQIEEEENNYIYEVDVEGVCLGKITVVLSKTRDPEASSVIEGASEWYNSGGTVTVEKEKLKAVTDLYLYLRDEDTQVTGTAVKVYYEALCLKKWYLTENRELALLPDRGKSAYEFSDRLRLYYTTQYGYETCYDLKLPDTRIGLEQLLMEKQLVDNKLDISGLNADEEEGVTLQACYKTQQGRSLYGRKIEAVLKKPVIKSCCFQNGSGVITMEEPGNYVISF